MKSIKKIIAIMLVTIYTSINAINTFALDIDAEAAVKEINDAKTAATIILNAAIVAACLYAIGKTGVKTLLTDDEDRDYKTFFTKVGKILAIGIIVGLSATLLIIFGIK